LPGAQFEFPGEIMAPDRTPRAERPGDKRKADTLDRPRVLSTLLTSCPWM